MEKELQDELFKKYPEIFRQKDLPKEQTAMCWGIDCGSGWHWIIDQLCSYIKFIMESRKDIEKCEAVQVKQKFGGLRFYINGGNEEIHNAICFAEHLSYQICEACGATKGISQNKSGYIQTLCKNCREKI